MWCAVAIESVCHSLEKRTFLKEARRLLKPGGRLILADGFATKRQGDAVDQQRMQSWLKGWACSNPLDQADTFRSKLEEEGFRNIQFFDITANVMPSSQRLYGVSWLAIPL